MTEIPTIKEMRVDSLITRLATLHALQDQGISVGNLPDETWKMIVEEIERNDAEKLSGVRKELEQIKKSEPEVIIGC
mgnify:CR=1 FL=1